ncbi:MAG: hypothetical protein KF878_28340 [Planctomycetes bacterium]|nr:hypothetical protein [Planctomycetota bacterium]
MERFAGLPGHDLVRDGLADLARGEETVAALLVSIGAPRLRRLGFDVSSPIADPERRLYLLLAREDQDSAHGRYNALVRRLVSFEQAAERASSCDPSLPRLERPGDERPRGWALP